jgi:hypothetical protein
MPVPSALHSLPRPGTAARPQAALLVRVQSEFQEMPGLQLTLNQAARLWHVDLATASSLMRALVDSQFLTARDGRYARRSV